MYEQREMDRLCPILDAPPAGPNTEDWDYDGIHEGCRVKGKMARQAPLRGELLVSWGSRLRIVAW